MKRTPKTSKQAGLSAEGPHYIWHPCFDEPRIAVQLGQAPPPALDLGGGHMPDELTREFTKRMHYAAYRMSRATRSAELRQWQAKYYGYRDHIVLGNRKLVFRAVRRWMPAGNQADDMASECQLVLIRAVAAYNPWLGIRFSTYAFTCLMRALSRLSQRYAADRLARSMPLESLPDGEPRDASSDEPPVSQYQRVDELLRDNNSLLSPRERTVLLRRFSLDDQGAGGTLEQVGRELGLSKERVRQVQATALSKLRKALLTTASSS